MIVVDASVAIKWVVEETGSAEAEELVGSGVPLVAPDVLVPEVVNILRKKLKRRELTGTQAKAAIARVFEPIGSFAAVTSLGAELFDLAVELDHPAYDCAYLLCSRQWNASLVSADAVLVTKSIQAGFRACHLKEWRKSLMS